MRQLMVLDSESVAGPCADVPVPAAARPRLLIRGAVHPAVRDAQRRLNAFHGSLVAAGGIGLPGAPLVEDCIFGRASQQVLIAFQQITFPGATSEHDGKLGPSTWAQFDRVAGVGVGGTGGGASGGTTAVSAFSTKLYPTEMVPGPAHNARLATALTLVRNGLATAQDKKTIDEVAIFVAKLTPSGQMEYAGVREHEMFFSGSLLKLTLLYASFELVARVNALAPHITAGSAPDFFAKVKADFDPKIVNAVPRITAGPWRHVSYDKALSAAPTTGGNFRVAMSPLHDQGLRSIFSNQNQNEGAKGCIRRLGFSFVNGNNDAAGFFGVVSETGIWMATDFIRDDAAPPIPNNWRSFNVPVSGGGTSSAACTCISVASMLTRMHREELIDAAASQTMRDIFRTGGSWITVAGAGGPYSFTSTGAKVGHSGSKSAGVGLVKSEAAFYQRTSDNTPFVCVWQNVPDTFAFRQVLQVIDEVIKTWP